MPEVAIVGYGALGTALGELFPDAAVYDEPKGLGTRDRVNGCAFAFVSAPTPPDSGGGRLE